MGEMTVRLLAVLAMTKLNDPHCRVDFHKGMGKNGYMKRTGLAFRFMY